MKKRNLVKGQTLVEFVLIFPIVLFLLIGFFDLGRAVFYYSSLTNAVREATRTMVVDDKHGNQEAIREAIMNKLDTFAFAISLNPNDIEISYFTDADDLRETQGNPTYVDGETTTIAIKATYYYQPVTPFINRLLNAGSIPLVTESTMRIAGRYR